MLIFITLFCSAFSLATLFFGSIFASVEAIEAVCALAIFACIALAIGVKVEKAWGWMMLAIILMVAVNFLRPYESFIEIAMSCIAALYGTYRIKHSINLFIRKNPGIKIPRWMRTVIRFI